MTADGTTDAQASTTQSTADQHTPGQDGSGQPWLHDLLPLLAAPTQVWSEAGGQVRELGLQGCFHGDRRVLSAAVVTVDGVEPVVVGAHPTAGDGDGDAGHVFVLLPRGVGDAGPDPTVLLERTRTVSTGLVRERLRVRSSASRGVRLRLEVAVAADHARLDDVKGGRRAAPVRPSASGDGHLAWTAPGLRCTLSADGATTSVADARAELCWDLEVPAGATVDREWALVVDDDTLVVTAPRSAPAWQAPSVTSDDRRLAPVVAQALADLRRLRLAPVDDPDEEFVGAGAPWFLTLFGRDSLWAARMLLPVTTSVAASTLRVLAARQGTRTDPRTAEQPGKVLHEVRDAAFGLGADPGGAVERHLPPVYYGTIDATPLWALTLHDAWRWGLPAEQVEPLLPALERALTWMVEHGDADGDHLLEYVDESGSGLSNQGWKDSGDAVRRADGSLAHPPVALCEVQGYAYAAARSGATLLEAFGRSGTDRWREWAEGTRREFARRFWVEDRVGPFPAIALDGDKQPVASLTSNVGHLLGTGILDAEQARLVARRLVAPDMLSGFGIRTLSRDAAGYSPTGYHVGSVWTHDTAVCLAGLAAEGLAETAPVLEALVATLHAFDGRPPELFSGDAREDHPVPVPYPAACRPQAWSAASAVVALAAATGLRADVPAGRVDLQPVTPWPFGRTVVDGLQAGGDPLRVEVQADGTGEVRWR